MKSRQDEVIDETNDNQIDEHDHRPGEIVTNHSTEHEDQRTLRTYERAGNVKVILREQLVQVISGPTKRNFGIAGANVICIPVAQCFQL